MTDNFKKQLEKVFGYAPTELSIKWTTGGMSGGSCWNDGAYYSLEAEPEPEFEDLDKLLTAICPAIPYLIFKKIESELVVEGDDCETEYYGNYTNYSIKSIDLSKLEQFLIENQLWNC